MTREPYVLAIGVDAAEPTLVRRLVDAGSLPVIGGLLQHGTWADVQAPADIGSGSVWPTFIAACGPAQHGVYGEWAWQPSTMSVSHYSGKDLRPFWKDYVERGLVVGVLDVPFMPRIGMTSGFEISEWGPHDILDGQTRADPASIAARVGRQPRHPLAMEKLDASGPRDYEALAHLGAALRQGIEQRGALAVDLIGATRPHVALIAFTEIHHASHHLWHRVDPDHPVYRHEAFEGARDVDAGLPRLFMELDRQIGRLIRETNPSSVVLFGLHGMRPARGIPALLPALLAEWGFSATPTWRTRSWRERAFTVLAAIKRMMPASVKRLYYRSVSQRTAQRFARPTMLPAYDWQRTRAFAMPSDQHGWIRLNLRGREARGIVEPADYDRIVDDLISRVTALRASDGRLLAERATRTAASAEQARTLPLPDVIVHWTDAVFDGRSIANSAVPLSVIGTKFSGQHAMLGFCVATGDAAGALRERSAGGVLPARDLHRIIGVGRA